MNHNNRSVDVWLTTGANTVRQFPLQKLMLTSMLAFSVASMVSSSVTYVANRFIQKQSHDNSTTNAVAAGLANGLAAGLGNFSIGAAGFLYDTKLLQKNAKMVHDELKLRSSN